MFMHFPCIHSLLLNILVIFELFWSFSDGFFLPPLYSVYVSPLQLGTLFVPVPLHLLILLLFLFGSVMMMPTRHSQRTFLDAAFILNAKSFWRTSLTPTFPLSFIVGNGSHCVTSRSHVLSCLSRSFTPTCTGLIV